MYLSLDSILCLPSFGNSISFLSIQGGQKQQASRILSLIALDKEVKDVLTILGLVSTSPSEVCYILEELQKAELHPKHDQNFLLK